MTVNTIKFSQFAAGSLTNTTNMLVGVTASSGGTNFKVPFPLSWTTGTRPSSPDNGVLGYNTSLGQYEYWNGAAWVQLAAGGSGTVNVGSANQLGYYASTGTAISALSNADNAVLLSNASGLPVWTVATNSSVLISTSGGIPEWGTTLPNGLTFGTGTTIPQPTLQQPNIVGVTNGSNAIAGDVGEYIENIILASSSVSISSGIPTDLTYISLTAGDWFIWGDISFSALVSFNIFAWISTLSSTIPNPALRTGINISQQYLVSDTCINAVPIRISVSTTTNVYISAYSLNGASICGGIFAERRR